MIRGYSEVPFHQQMMDLDPHKYTSGRWLCRDQEQRDKRYLRFDLNALCRRILELCPGANSISKCQKIEGAFNRVFIFTLDNSERIVIRLPFTLAGPSKLITASEVATIKYLQAKMSIPIPKIIDWNDESSNSVVGSEYIIMEHVKGIQLHKKWPDMAGNERVRCIEAIYKSLKEIVDLEFPAFGSINFEESLQSDCKQSLDKGFCIGPHSASRYWKCNSSEPRYYHNIKSNHGPWATLDEYCEGLVDAGLSRIPPNDIKPGKRPFYHGSVQAHLDLLEHVRAILKRMCADPRIQTAATPTLFHPDLHKRNIYISEDDPSQITGIIDWQSASIEPAFWFADEMPDFAIPDDDSGSNNICAKAFDTCSRFLTPKLSGPRLMDENLFRPFLYSYRTWTDGTVALRHELIETTRRWNEVGFVGSSPYVLPSQTELDEHDREYKLFVAAQQLKHDLSTLLNAATDGWVPSDEWEATQAAHEEVFNGMLTAVLSNRDPDYDEPVKDEGVLRSIWPYDLKSD